MRGQTLLPTGSSQTSVQASPAFGKLADRQVKSRIMGQADKATGKPE